MRLALWFLFVGSFAAINLYGRAEGPPPDDDIVYQYDFAIGSVASYAVLLSLVLALTIGLPRREVLALRSTRLVGQRARARVRLARSHLRRRDDRAVADRCR